MRLPRHGVKGDAVTGSGLYLRPAGAASAPDGAQQKGAQTDCTPRHTRAENSGLDVTGKALVEARQAAATVDQLLLAAGPGRMGGGIDVEGEFVALRTPGRTGLLGRAVIERHFDKVVAGVNTLFHGRDLLQKTRWKRRLIGDQREGCKLLLAPSPPGPLRPGTKPPDPGVARRSVSFATPLTLSILACG